MKNAIRMSILGACVAMLVLGRASWPAQAAQMGHPPRVVPIAARRFEFVPNQITLKKGEPVILQLSSEDVTHGFFVRPLKIDEDIEAGQTKQVPLTPQVAGKFTTICDHFCGVNHGAMHMTIEVVE